MIRETESGNLPLEMVRCLGHIGRCAADNLPIKSLHERVAHQLRRPGRRPRAHACSTRPISRATRISHAGPDPGRREHWHFSGALRQDTDATLRVLRGAGIAIARRGARFSSRRMTTLFRTSLGIQTFAGVRSPSTKKNELSPSASSRM